MKVEYALSLPVLAADTEATVDLLVSFKADSSSDAIARRPLNLSLVIDRSGSMAGAPLKHAIRAACDLVDRLSSDDTLSIVVYDDTVNTLLAPQRVTDPAAIRDLLGHVRAGGLTNLSGGWLTGCTHVKAGGGADRLNRVLLLTDGQANAGIRDAATLINTARERAEEGIVTTTLGFGSSFNEDLLIGMASAAAGNFYFIQSPDDAADVFRIELESLESVAAQNLVAQVRAKGATQIVSVLNNYRTKSDGGDVVVSMGDVYRVEDKVLAIELRVPAHGVGGADLLSISWTCDAIEGAVVRRQEGDLSISARVGTRDEVEAATPDAAVVEQTSRLRIAKIKDEAVELADKGDFAAASEKLRFAIDDIKLRFVAESFEVAEEIDHLSHYAEQIANRRFDTASRKEMRDQSYQARARSRNDLALRGVGSGSAEELEVVTSEEGGVVVRCMREGGKLRVRAVSDGYNPDFNVQFPRRLREEGVTYLVEDVKESSDGAFYKASGAIKRLVRPGEEHLYRSRKGAAARKGTGKASTVKGTAADLETTDAVGSGVLVQCVKDGSKLRARVVSDGYDASFNMRFARSIREEGMLYVVDEVIDGPSRSYIACGKIKRFVQPT